MAVKAAIKASKFAITEVVSGGAKGVDSLGEVWAHSMGVPVKVFPADWDKHGKKAGFVRNAEMAEYADALIAVWDGQSRGTYDMIRKAEAFDLERSITYVANVWDETNYGQVIQLNSFGFSDDVKRALVVPLE